MISIGLGSVIEFELFIVKRVVEIMDWSIEVFNWSEGFTKLPVQLTCDELIIGFRLTKKQVKELYNQLEEQLEVVEI